MSSSSRGGGFFSSLKSSSCSGAIDDRLWFLLQRRNQLFSVFSWYRSETYNDYCFHFVQLGLYNKLNPKACIGEEQSKQVTQGADLKGNCYKRKKKLEKCKLFPSSLADCIIPLSTTELNKNNSETMQNL